MTFLIPLLLRAGLPSRFGKAAAWIVTVLLAFGLIVGGVLILRSVARSHDKSVASEAVTSRDRDLSLEAYNMVVTAGENATVNQMARDEIAADNQKELRDEAAKGDATAVGPGTAAVLQRMRDQQAARRR
jgi:CobQ-like glutamine amidotransferase family enzyme